MQGTEHYNIYMMGAVSGEDGPKTRELRAAMGDAITALGHNLLSPHVAYDTEQTTFRERVGGTQAGISRENKKLMQQAHLFVGEGSGTSEGRGYEVAYGLFVCEVPVVVLRHESNDRGTSMIYGEEHELLYADRYTEETLTEKLTTGIKWAKGKLRK